MGNTRLSMKFVLASLCISIALFQVAHATTTCSLPYGTKKVVDLDVADDPNCETDPMTPASSSFCKVTDVTSMVCRTGASGTPAIAGLACATDKTVFTGATFCTLVEAGIEAKFTGLAADKLDEAAEKLLLAEYIAELTKKVCGVTGDIQCIAGDITTAVVTRRADTSVKITLATSAVSADTALASLKTIADAASLTAIKALATEEAPEVLPFADVTLITVTKSVILVNGVMNSASSMFQFSFLATAMSVAAMVYSKL